MRVPPRSPRQDSATAPTLQTPAGPGGAKVRGAGPAAADGRAASCRGVSVQDRHPADRKGPGPAGGAGSPATQSSASNSPLSTGSTSTGSGHAPVAMAPLRVAQLLRGPRTSSPLSDRGCRARSGRSPRLLRVSTPRGPRHGAPVCPPADDPRRTPRPSSVPYQRPACSPRPGHACPAPESGAGRVAGAPPCPPCTPATSPRTASRTVSFFHITALPCPLPPAAPSACPATGAAPSPMFPTPCRPRLVPAILGGVSSPDLPTLKLAGTAANPPSTTMQESDTGPRCSPVDLGEGEGDLFDEVPVVHCSEVFDLPPNPAGRRASILDLAPQSPIWASPVPRRALVAPSPVAR
eukprot:EG_transcript_6720